MRALLTGAMILVGCRAQSSVQPPADPHSSTIVLHGSFALPVEVRTAGVMASERAQPRVFGSVAASPRRERFERAPVAVACPRETACAVVFGDGTNVTVFAFDQVVKVEIAARKPPRYRDAHSSSAQLGAILATTATLARACERKDLATAAREQASLRTRVKRTRDPTVRDAARLALATDACAPDPNDAADAREVFAIAPDSPALRLWPFGLLAARRHLANPEDGDAPIAAVVEQHPDPEVGAALLFAQQREQLERGDIGRAERTLAQLHGERFARTVSGKVAKSLAMDGKWVRLAPGDTLPALALERIDATGTVDVAASAGRARLLYFSASWCGGCIDALPSLRRYAAAHPEVDIIYTLVDDPDDARAFVREHAPVPGTAVRADEDARARIAREILKQIALPTFVLVDADNRVLATSNETDLD